MLDVRDSRNFPGSQNSPPHVARPFTRNAPGSRCHSLPEHRRMSARSMQLGSRHHTTIERPPRFTNRRGNCAAAWTSTTDYHAQLAGTFADLHDLNSVIHSKRYFDAIGESRKYPLAGPGTQHCSRPSAVLLLMYACLDTHRRPMLW